MSPNGHPDHPQSEVSSDQHPVELQDPAHLWHSLDSYISSAVVLDETGVILYACYQALAEGRTTILVSHRFPTVRSADHIVVLAGGRVVEEGTHTSLVAADGRYGRLFKLQAQGYS